MCADCRGHSPSRSRGSGPSEHGLRLHRPDPALLTGWLQLIAGTVPALLLHCRPRHRRARCLVAVFEHVHVSRRAPRPAPRLPARPRDVRAEALEMTPVRTLLYSSDGYGGAEFHCLGALSFRRGLAGVLQDRVDAGERSLPDALRLARWAGAHDARRVYRLPGAS